MDATCHVEPIQKIATLEEQQATAVILLGVEGMGCPNCAARVRNGLLAINGVIEADVDHVTGTAHVEFNPNLVTIQAMCEAIARAGNDGHHRYNAFSVSDPLCNLGISTRDLTADVYPMGDLISIGYRPPVQEQER